MCHMCAHVRKSESELPPRSAYRPPEAPHEFRLLSDRDFIDSGYILD